MFQRSAHTSDRQNSAVPEVLPQLPQTPSVTIGLGLLRSRSLATSTSNSKNYSQPKGGQRETMSEEIKIAEWKLQAKTLRLGFLMKKTLTMLCIVYDTLC